MNAGKLQFGSNIIFQKPTTTRHCLDESKATIPPQKLLFISKAYDFWWLRHGQKFKHKQNLLLGKSLCVWCLNNCCFYMTHFWGFVLCSQWLFFCLLIIVHRFDVLLSKNCHRILTVHKLHILSGVWTIAPFHKSW